MILFYKSNLRSLKFPSRTLYKSEFKFLLNYKLLFLGFLMVFLIPIEGVSVKSTGLKMKKRDLGESEGYQDSLTVDNGERTKAGKGKGDERGTLRFEQLVTLAQEEAKCLQIHGVLRSPPSSPFSEDDFYSPYICSKTLEMYDYCGTCRNLTSGIRTEEECSTYCGKSDSFCRNTCTTINQAVLKIHGEFDEKEADVGDQRQLWNKTENSSIMRSTLNNFEVFCEGIYNKTDESNEGENTNHFIVLRWNFKTEEKVENSSEVNLIDNFTTRTSPTVFVLQKFSASTGRWESLGKTMNTIQAVNVRYYSDTYKWKITAVGPGGFLNQLTSPEYTTINGYIKPGPPKKIYVVRTLPVENNSSMVNVLIGWDPPKEKACYYKIVVATHEFEKQIRIKEPLGVHRYGLTVQSGTHYSLLITSRDPSWDQNSESNLTRLDFKTPTCLESFKYRFDRCAPPPPRDIESRIQENSEEKTVTVRLSWKPPFNASNSNPILHYLITISSLNYKTTGGSGNVANSMSMMGHASKPINLNGSFPYINFSVAKHVRQQTSKTLFSSKVAGNTTRVNIPGLDINSDYKVTIQAESYKGSSEPAQYHLITKIQMEMQPLSPFSNWVYFAIIIFVVIIFVCSCNMGRIYMHKRRTKKARNAYFQSMEERDALSADWSIVPLTDETATWKLFDDNFPKEKWGIAYENLIMGEVVGQGAFGVVRRAKIHRKHLSPSTLKYLDKGKSYLEEGDKNEEGDMETVAVKMLKVSATRDDCEQLVKEIMTMHNLNHHPQIVGLIGACTRGRSLSLVLEYCSGGDLLTFMRKVRAKYWPTLGLQEAKKSTSGGSSLMSKAENSLKSCPNGSGKTTHSGESRLEESAPVNYVDLGHSSECSSRDNEGSLINEHPRGTLQTNKSHSQSQKSFEMEDPSFRPIDERDVLSYARQIAMGMEYLEKNRIVHRDLATRNCLLLGDHKQLKLSDFGLSRDIYTWNVYQQKSNGKLPIKWMAIESIFTHVFTSKSDVWSFGICLWELVTLGGTPYPGLGNSELFDLLKSGYRMERPDNCSEELYALMKKCWRTGSASRPNFTELKNHIQDMMEAAEPNLYLSLMADIPSDYFRLSSRSDLLQLNNTNGTTTEGGSNEGYTISRSAESTSTINHNRQKSLKFSKNSQTVSLSPTGGQINLESVTGMAKYSPQYSLSNSTASGCNSNGNSQTSSCNNKTDTSFKQSLVSVPEKSGHTQNEATNNNNIEESQSIYDKEVENRSAGSIRKSVSMGSNQMANECAKITSLVLDQPSYSCKHVNRMTIIENKTYDLT